MHAKIKILFSLSALLLMACLASSCSSHLCPNSTGISTVEQQLGTAASSQQDLAQLKMQLTTSQTQLQLAEEQSLQLKQQLTTSQEQLQLAEEQTVQLKQQLSSLTAHSQQTESLLASANQSLQLYKQEEQKKLSKAKLQRSLWFTVAGGLLVYCLAK